MRTFEITEKEVAAAFREAESGEAKKILAALFCKEEMVKPTLDDYKTIRTYEDACKALGEPIFEDPNNLPNHIIALMKLETISRALWGRNFQPKPDGEGSKVYWYPWFALWTKKEVEDMNPEQRGALLSAFALSGAFAGFGCLSALIFVPRLRLRPLGSACAKKRKKRLSILGSNSLNFGLNI
jgi:hypothetical protein